MITITRKTNNIMMVYLFDNKVNAISNAPIQNAKRPLLYESKGSLHKLIYILKVIQIGSLFSPKDVIKLAIIINAVNMINNSVDIYFRVNVSPLFLSIKLLHSFVQLCHIALVL